MCHLHLIYREEREKKKTSQRREPQENAIGQTLAMKGFRLLGSLPWGDGSCRSVERLCLAKKFNAAILSDLHEDRVPERSDSGNIRFREYPVPG